MAPRSVCARSSGSLFRPSESGSYSVHFDHMQPVLRQIRPIEDWCSWRPSSTRGKIMETQPVSNNRRSVSEPRCQAASNAAPQVLEPQPPIRRATGLAVWTAGVRQHHQYGAWLGGKFLQDGADESQHQRTARRALMPPSTCLRTTRTPSSMSSAWMRGAP